MNLGNVILDPGHVNGANVDPDYPAYSEGTAMYLLATMIGKPMTRTSDTRPELYERAETARLFGADTLISLHSNYPTKGVTVYYSIKRPEDEGIAETLGQAIADILQIDFNGAEAVENAYGEDYYGIIRYSIREGIPHVFLVEHGAHSELAEDTIDKLQRIAYVYNKLLFKKEDDGMLIVIPYGIPDYGPSLMFASNAKGAVLDWSMVGPNDDVVQIGGPVTSEPKIPCKSFRVISGADRKATALAVINAL